MGGDSGDNFCMSNCKQQIYMIVMMGQFYHQTI